MLDRLGGGQKPRIESSGALIFVQNFLTFLDDPINRRASLPWARLPKISNTS